MAALDAGWIVLLSIGAIDGCLGLALAHLLRKARRAKLRRARIAATPTSTIASAPMHGLVELAGTAVPVDESSLVTAPLSGTRCLWWRVVIDEVNGSSTTRLLDLREARDFYIDDHSGSFARVQATGAAMGLTTHEANPAHRDNVQRFLASQGHPTTTEDLLWFEERLDAHAQVYVLGAAREPTPPPTSGGPFRTGRARERLVVEAPDGGELVISVGHEAALAAQLELDAREAIRYAKVAGLIAALFSLATAAVAFEVLHGF